MRSNLYSKSEFFLRAKKKPAQQELLDNIENLSESDIHGCGQPLWIREALLELKKRDGKTASQTAVDIANQMETATQENSITELFPIYQWTGPNTFVGGDMEGHRLQLEIKSDDTFLVDYKQNQVKVGSTIVMISSNGILDLMTQSNYLSDMSYLEYLRMVNS